MRTRRAQRLASRQAMAARRPCVRVISRNSRLVAVPSASIRRSLVERHLERLVEAHHAVHAVDRGLGALEQRRLDGGHAAGERKRCLDLLAHRHDAVDEADLVGTPGVDLVLAREQDFLRVLGPGGARASASRRCRRRSATRARQSGRPRPPRSRRRRARARSRRRAPGPAPRRSSASGGARSASRCRSRPATRRANPQRLRAGPRPAP